MNIITEAEGGGQSTQVIKRADGKFDVVTNGVVRHPECDAESAMRALGQYLQSALYRLEKAGGSAIE